MKKKPRYPCLHMYSALCWYFRHTPEGVTASQFMKHKILFTFWSSLRSLVRETIIFCTLCNYQSTRLIVNLNHDDTTVVSCYIVRVNIDIISFYVSFSRFCKMTCLYVSENLAYLNTVQSDQYIVCKWRWMQTVYCQHEIVFFIIWIAVFIFFWKYVDMTNAICTIHHQQFLCVPCYVLKIDYFLYLLN